MTEREEFEAWAVQFGVNTALAENFADYADGTTWKMWKAWQAARRADEALMREALRVLENTRAAISGMKAEAETAGAGGDEQMLQDAVETISNDGLEAETVLYAFISKLSARLKPEGETT
jgi:hypothetical protein